MPAVTPAAVHTDAELRTKIGSGSTSMAGNSRAICPANAQCVVAGQPSSSPACAARKAPVHTLTTRRDVVAAARIQAMTSGFWRTASMPAPPGRTTVSMGCQGSGSGLATISSPVPVLTGLPSSDAMVTS
ncbi:MAG: hypothetical protein QOI25_2961 [Mycobacterium sp.]|nr:hypothetical protein [Mycobacterium sp.]